MGANIGTTVTSWILSLSGLQGDSFVIKMLKPTSFSPILAIIGVCLLLFSKKDKKKDAGSIMIGFAVLMFGMETMSGAVKPLADVPEFTNILLMFKNPVLGMLAGAVLTGDHSKLFGFCRYSAGAVCDWCGVLWGCDPDHHGTEYRYLCNRPDFGDWSEKECKTDRVCPSLFQPDRNDCVYDSVLLCKFLCTFWIFR